MVTREQISEQFAERREALEERRQELMVRAAELRERFSESVTEETVSYAVGLTLVSTGLAWGVTMWLRGRRSFVALLFPIGLLAGGLAVLASGAWSGRSGRIGAAEQRISAELEALDPIARMQVLKDMGARSIPFVKVEHN